MASMAVHQGRRSRSVRWVTFCAIVFGLLTAYLVVRYVSQQTSEQKLQNVATVSVVVARQEIPQAGSITADLVERRLVTPDVAVASALTQANQAIGQRARYPIAAGAQLTPTMLVKAGSSDALSFVVPPGRRAVAVATSVVIGGGNHILPGDFVDVMAILDLSRLAVPTSASISGQRQQGVTTILQNVQVLAVADDAAKVAGSGPQGTKKSDNPPALDKNGSVTLAVDPAEAQLLFLAESEGKIRLALRPFGDQEVKPVPAALGPLGGQVR